MKYVDYSKYSVFLNPFIYNLSKIIEENIPNWLINEICDASELLEDPENASDMTCPKCNGTMKKKK